MADLSPDLSVYHQQGGLGGQSLNDLLGLVARSRELQSQQAESDALRASGGDPEAAKQLLMRPGAPGFVSGHTISSLTNAAQSQFELHKHYMGEAGGAISSLLSRQDKDGNLTATVDDWHRMSPLLSQYHVPQSMLDAVEQSASKDGRLNKDRLLDIQSYVNPQGTPTTPVTTGGITRNVPNVALQREGTANPPTPPTRPQATAQPSQPGKPQYEDTAATAANEVLQNQPRYPAGTTDATNLNSKYKVGTELYNAHTLEAGDYAAKVKPWDEMISLMREGNDGTTGRGLDALNKVKNTLLSFNIWKPEDKAEIDKVSRFEQLKKYMVQAVQSGTLGTTDARMMEGIMGNPNPDLLTQSNMKLAQVMLGMMKRNTIAKNEFDRQGIGNINPGLYGDWRANWDKKQDTTGFVWDHMTTKERQAYRTAHPERDAAVGASWQAARRAGVSPKLESDQ